MTTRDTPPSTALRVCWAGANPMPGDGLQKSARVAYRIRSVKVLHRAELSPKPRLLLTVTRLETGGAVSGTVHPWERTARPSSGPSRLAPDPKPLRTMTAPERAARGLLTSEERARTAREKRLVSEQDIPAKADPSAWSDPSDTVNTRSPRQIKGHRRGDWLGKQYRRQNTDITRDHVEAASRFRCDWDVAQFGLSAGDVLARGFVGGGFGPSAGPTAAASARAVADREVRRVLAAIGPTAAPLLIWTVCENRDVRSFCMAQSELLGEKQDEKKAFGRLLGVLDRLAEHYGINERRDRVKASRYDLERR